MKVPLNLKWHDNIIATGGMIDTLEKFEWLVTNNIGCVISLCDYPDFIRKKMSEAHMSQAFRKVYENDSPPIEGLSDFIAGHVVDDCKIYIHCNAGANRSPKLARAFLAKKELFIVKYLAKRANDLNHGDDFDWTRGHSAFSGDTLGRAISVLEDGLDSQDEKTLFYSADTLIELMEHADHGCFDVGSVQRLKGLCSRVLEVLLQTNPENTDEYIEILNRFNPVQF